MTFTDSGLDKEDPMQCFFCCENVQPTVGKLTVKNKADNGGVSNWYTNGE